MLSPPAKLTIKGRAKAKAIAATSPTPPTGRPQYEMTILLPPPTNDAGGGVSGLPPSVPPTTTGSTTTPPHTLPATTTAADTGTTSTPAPGAPTTPLPSTCIKYSLSLNDLITYNALWEEAAPNATSLAALPAVAFFNSSKLTKKDLKIVWAASDLVHGA
jgi:hypothetical protein